MLIVQVMGVRSALLEFFNRLHGNIEFSQFLGSVTIFFLCLFFLII